MKKIRVGLNGFGRIGRAFTRIATERESFEIVAVNTGKTTPEMLAYLLKYDSVYRTFNHAVEKQENGIKIDDAHIASYNIRSPEDIPWEKHNVDVVVDCTGVFKTRDDLGKHLHGSVQKVVLTAPAKDDSIPYVVLGVNDGKFDFTAEKIVSNASCTTNCAAPLFKVLHDALGVTAGFLTTTHAYTSSQALLDNTGKTYGTSRAAALSIIPSTTGAAKAVAKVIPDLKGKLDGMALRVPTPTGSFTDVSAIVSKKTTPEEVNALFKSAGEGPMKGILGYATDTLVSSDYIASPYSSVFDSNYTKVINGTLVKVFSWYDNEWGYSTRLVDLVERLGSTI